MNSKSNYAGKTTSMQLGLFKGLVVSLLATGIIALLLALAIHLEKLQWNNVGYGIMLLILVSSFLGSLTSRQQIRRKRLIVCLLAGILYCLALLSMTALFFGGQYEAVGVTAGLILAGSGTAGLLEFRVKDTKKVRGIRKAYR